MRKHGLAAAVAVVAVLVGLGVTFAALTGPPQPASSYVPPTAIPTFGAAPKLVLPDAARVLVFGDSYAFGVGASAPEQGFAYRLAEAEGWEAVVSGVPGTGYLDPGSQRIGAYPERMAELDVAGPFDLIILQGSTNDFDLDHTLLPAAVTATIEAAHAKFPGTPIVMLGPVTYGDSPARLSVNEQLTSAAAANSTIYLSPIGSNWFTGADRATLRDEATGHPNDIGHQALADRLVLSFGALTS